MPNRPPRTPDPDAGANATPVEGAGGVVFDPAGRVLLIRYRSGAWVFPKGHLDPGEDHLQAALREVAEEAGIHARPSDPAVRFVTEYVNDRGEARRITWFRLETDAREPTLLEKGHPEGAFLPVDEALERLSYDEDRALLRRVTGAA